MSKHKSNKKTNKETRALVASELRATDNNGAKTLSGYAIVWNSRSVDLGGFVEECDPGMLTRTLREQPDILALRDHVSSQILGRSTAGTLQLRTDERGLAFTVALPDTVIANDTYANVAAGNLSACSFGFATRSDSWSKVDGQVVRRLLDIDLAEVSVTSFAAYPATSVSLRYCPQEFRSLLDILDDDTDEDDCDCEVDEDGKCTCPDSDNDNGDEAEDEADFIRHTALQLAIRRLR